MPVYKVYKNENYTTMSNVHLRDDRLSLKAKGLLSLMLCLPPDWKYSISGFTAVCKEGRRSIASAFKELEEFGYVVVEKKLPEKNNPKLDYIYHIYEIPDGALGDEARRHSSTKCAAHNVQHKTAQELNTDYKGDTPLFSGEEEFLPSSSSTYNLLASSDFVPPTLDEVRAFCAANMMRHVDPEVFHSWHEARGWVVNGSPIVNWQSALASWEVRDRNKAASEKQTDYSKYDASNWERG